MVAKTFDAVGDDRCRICGSSTSRTPATGKTFRTSDDRSAYALAFYRFNPSPVQKALTEPIRAAAEAAKPPGATVGVTGEDTLAAGRQ